MNVLVVGGGHLGRKTAELLDAAGHDVAVTDENEENLSLLSRDFGGITSVGFPMDLNHLKAAGIENCDAVVVAMADDNLNITVGQIAKDVFHVPKVVVRISDPAREDVFDSFGFSTVCPTNMAGEKIIGALTSPWQSRQVTFGAATILLEARPVEKKFFGGSAQACQLAPGEGLFGVLKWDGKVLFGGSLGGVSLEQGDWLICGRQVD